MKIKTCLMLFCLCIVLFTSCEDAPISQTQSSVPHIDDVSPEIEYVGRSVTINGSNFGKEELAGCYVKIGNSLANVESWQDDEIRVTVPTDYGTGIEDASFVAQVLSLALAGWMGGLPVEEVSSILADLFLDQAQMQITLNFDENAPWWENLAKFMAAIGIPGVKVRPEGDMSMLVTVRTPAGESNSELFTFRLPPIITAIEPSQPKATGGQWLTIKGLGFTSGSVVLLHMGDSTYTVSPEDLLFISSSELDVFVELTVSNAAPSAGSTPAFWYDIQVINSGDIASIPFPFEVAPQDTLFFNDEELDPPVTIGPVSGKIDQSLTYSALLSTSNTEDDFEYRFDWGDGSYSEWASSSSASHTWSNAGTYQIRAQARYTTNHNIASNWGLGFIVEIIDSNAESFVTLKLYVHEDSASGPTISGATVTGQDGDGNSFSQTTNSNGYVTITGVPSTWNFTASKSGYNTNSWSQSITTTTAKHAYLTKGDVTLTLYVHENSASGPIISGATVTGQDGGGNSFSQTTNSNGYVTITGVPGTWQFTASKSGYNANNWSQSITSTTTKHAYLIGGEAPPSPPTLVDVGIASESDPWPPQTFLQATPGDKIITWYTFSYSGPNMLVRLKTTVLDSNGKEIGNQLTGPGFQIINPFENPIRGVGVEYELSDEAISGTYDVKFSIWSEDDAQQYHSVLKSGWLRLVLEEETETISTPGIPTGPSTGEVNQSLIYSTGGASSSLGHSLEYRFDWGDGSYSNWSSSTTASHSWSSQGTYAVRVQARCATHTSVVSGWSSGPSVNISLPASVSASIDGYSPSSTVQATVGSSTTISVTFTNTGNTAWSFIAGATVWDSNGNQVANYSKTLSTALQPGQQTTMSWTHPVNQAGDYWLQFGVWKDSSTLLNKAPSPSQKLIVGNEPATFNIGDRVRVTTNLNVRTGAGTSYPEISDPDYPGYAPAGTTGTVLSGPVSANGYVWWQIQYDAGYMGWSVEGGLERV